MKKILGILLAVCFVLSVTAASASASGADYGGKKVANDGYSKKVVNDGYSKSLKHDQGKNIHQWKNKLWMWVWVPGHFDKKVIKTVKIVHHKKIVIKKVIKIWIPGHWELELFKCNKGMFNKGMFNNGKH
jgi:hypothetical protein